MSATDVANSSGSGSGNGSSATQNTADVTNSGASSTTANNTAANSGSAGAVNNTNNAGAGGGEYTNEGGQSAPGTRVYVGNLPWSTSWQDLKDHFRQAGEVVYATVFLDEDHRSRGCGIVEFATREEALNAIATLHDTEIGFNHKRAIFVREDREDRGRRSATRGGARGGSASAAASSGNIGGGRASATSLGAVGSEQQRPRDRVREGGAAGAAAGRGRGGAGRGGRSSFAPQGGDATSPAAGGDAVKGRQLFVGNIPYTTTWQELKEHFRTYGDVERANVLYSGSRSRGCGTVLFARVEDAQKAIQALHDTEFQGRPLVVHEDKWA